MKTLLGSGGQDVKTALVQRGEDSCGMGVKTAAGLPSSRRFQYDGLKHTIYSVEFSPRGFSIFDFSIFGFLVFWIFGFIDLDLDRYDLFCQQLWVGAVDGW